MNQAPTASLGRAEPVKLLWTGGWDSTYRLLDLVVVQGRCVQPYHVALQRSSAARELHSMRAIREHLFERHPKVRSLLLDTIILEPQEDHELHQAYLELRALSGPKPPGGQLYWLAATAKGNGLDAVELGLHAERGAPWYELLRCNLEEIDGIPRLSTASSVPELAVFRPFAFPLLDLTKEQMAQRSEDFGFSPILELSWFCYTPDRLGRPCGMCPPCRLTIDQGLGRRIPAAKRAKSRLLSPIASMLRKHRVRARGRSALASFRAMIGTRQG